MQISLDCGCPSVGSNVNEMYAEGSGIREVVLESPGFTECATSVDLGEPVQIRPPGIFRSWECDRW